MLGFDRWHLFKMLAAALCVVGACSLLLTYLIPAPPLTFTIATGAKNQTYEAIAKGYREILARSHVDLDVRLTNGAADNIKLLNDPTSGIKVGIVQGGISDRDQSPDLMSLGRINYQIFWIFHSTAETLDDLRQLKGKRIAVGPQGSGQRVMAEKILGISGVTSGNTTMRALSAQGAVDALNDGKVDALFLPFALDAPILLSLLKNPRVRPMSFTEAEALTRIFPFLVRLVLPRAVIDFESIIPATDMILIASPNAVLVRKDIHPAFINLLAQAIIGEHGRPGVFQKAGEFPTQTDPEYPMSASAVDFYKNGPSFLNKYCPTG
jgi:NMT1-like family